MSELCTLFYHLFVHLGIHIQWGFLNFVFAFTDSCLTLFCTVNSPQLGYTLQILDAQIYISVTAVQNVVISSCNSYGYMDPISNVLFYS